MTGILNKKVAFVTGGGGGIGRATSLVMAREGAWVAIADKERALAEETAEEVRAIGSRAFVVTGDVSDEEQVAAMIASVVTEFGRLDCAFNNAGIGTLQAGAVDLKTHQMPLEITKKILDTNLLGIWLCMKYEIIQMLKQGSGSIVNNSSAAGLFGLPNSSIYVASKHGILGLTKTAALEYAENKIRVNAICPGFIETQHITKHPEEKIKRLTQMVPMRRLGQPSEVGECASWLCSDRASYVTGAVYTLDGGYTAA